MSGITIKLNFVGNLPGASSFGTLVVASDAEYCRASDLIRSVSFDEVRAIWVRQEHHFTWLKAQVEMFGMMGDGTIEVSRTTPRTLLADRWKLEIPTWLTDDLILEHDLLKKDLPDGAIDAARGLLSPVLGSLPEKVSARKLAALAEKASCAEIAAELDTPLLKAAWLGILDQWTQSGAPTWVDAFCKRMVANPNKLWADLTTWHLLRNYPDSALDYALDPASAAFMRGMPVDATSFMAPSPEGRQRALDQIEQIFAAARSTVITRQRFENLLAASSGELLEEFDAL